MSMIVKTENIVYDKVEVFTNRDGIKKARFSTNDGGCVLVTDVNETALVRAKNICQKKHDASNLLERNKIMIALFAGRSQA